MLSDKKIWQLLGKPQEVAHVEPVEDPTLKHFGWNAGIKFVHRPDIDLTTMEEGNRYIRQIPNTNQAGQMVFTIFQPDTYYMALFAKHNSELYIQLVGQYRPSINGDKIGPAEYRDDMPGGYKFKSESADDGVMREHFEETKVDSNLISIVPSFDPGKGYTEMIYMPRKSIVRVGLYQGKIETDPYVIVNEKMQIEKTLVHWAKVSDLLSEIATGKSTLGSPGIFLQTMEACLHPDRRNPRLIDLLESFF